MKIWLIIIFLSVKTFLSFGQDVQNRFRPFTLLVIHPTSAKIDNLLKPYADSLERNRIDRHKAASSFIDKLTQALSDEKIREFEDRMPGLKYRATMELDFKYYQTVSELTLFELNSLYNPTHWENGYSPNNKVMTGYASESSKLIGESYKELSKTYDVDYIITFENIRTENNSNDINHITLKFTSILYSAKKKNVVLRKEFTGNSQLRDYESLNDIFFKVNQEHRQLERSIDCDNYLDCLFKSAIRNSTSEIYETIGSIQKK